MENDNMENEKIAELKRQLLQYQQYIMNLPVYEYHIDKIHVEKVKGVLQLGQILDEDKDPEKGIHKIFIEDVLIREIEGSGIVGIGITEKDVHKKKKQKKVSPDEARSELRQIYEEIKTEIGLHEVPVFFQQLAVEENVLKNVWTLIRTNEVIRESAKGLAVGVNRNLTKVVSDIDNEIPDNGLFQHEHICNKSRQELADLVKTYAIVVVLLHRLLPGYLKKAENPQVNVGELNKLQNPEPDRIIKKLLKGYQLKFSPETLELLNEHSTTLSVLYNEIFIPLNRKGKDQEFMESLLSVAEEGESAGNLITGMELTVSEQAFLFSVLIESLTGIPAKIYINRLIFLLCK